MAHLHAAYKCNLCYEIPTSPLFYCCPDNHQYCSKCFRELQNLNNDNRLGNARCIQCGYSGRFEESNINPQSLKALAIKPRVGRPLLGITKTNNNSPNEALLAHQSKSQGDLRAHRASNSFFSHTRKPITCPHDGCKKSVAFQSLMDHFKHDHRTVPNFRITKNQQLLLSFDVSLVEYDRTFCMAVIHLCESNTIDVTRSRSSQSVINACKMLSKEIPSNNFWLIMSGSSGHYNQFSTFAILWLYCNEPQQYWCTIELSSKNDRTSISCFCSTLNLHESGNIEHIVKSMNCLYITRGTFFAMLRDDDTVNLRITVH